jgi:membrane-associated protease RseP (regulator of RpoE activity)
MGGRLNRICTKSLWFLALIAWLGMGQALAQGQGGVGIYLDYDPPGSGNLVVFSVSYKSPADKAQVKRGDQLVKVNGQEVAGKSLEEVAGMIVGPVGSSVALSFLREGTPVEVSLVRVELKSKAPLALPPPSQGGPSAVGPGDPYTFNDLEKHLVKQKILALKTPEERDKMLQLLTALKERKITTTQFMERMKKEFP